MKSLTEDRLGGLILFLGAGIVLITIFFEYKMGWIGIQRPESGIPKFMLENWADLEFIWAWEMLGHSRYLSQCSKSCGFRIFSGMKK